MRIRLSSPISCNKNLKINKNSQHTLKREKKGIFIWTNSIEKKEANSQLEFSIRTFLFENTSSNIRSLMITIVI